MRSFFKAIIALCVVLNLVLVMSLLLIRNRTQPESLTPAAAVMSPADEAAWVNQQVDNWQLTSEEKRFEQIGWVPNIDEGLKEAARLKRPIFMFCVVGEVDKGRC